MSTAKVSDLETYFFINILAPNLSLTDQSIQDYIKANYNWDWTQQDIERFKQSNKPKNYQLAPFLKDKGFTTANVCETLQITRQSVANCMQKAKLTTTNKYTNIFLHQYRLQQEYIKNPPPGVMISSYHTPSYKDDEYI